MKLLSQDTRDGTQSKYLFSMRKEQRVVFCLYWRICSDVFGNLLLNTTIFCKLVLFLWQFYEWCVLNLLRKFDYLELFFKVWYPGQTASSSLAISQNYWIKITVVGVQQSMQKELVMHVKCENYQFSSPIW